MTKSGHPDFQAHLATLESRGLLRSIDRPIDKDSELHPLVRWQFQGGIPESERKAFLFTNVTDSDGREYDMPVVVFNFLKDGNIQKAISGARIGTLVTSNALTKVEI